MAILCATPPPDIGMVQGLLTSVDCNVRGLTEAGYGALATGNSPMAAILTLMLTLYIAFIGYGLLIGRTPLRVGDVTISALKIGGILALATSWPTYQQLVFETLFHGPEQFAAGMMGSIEPSGSDQIGPFAGLQAAYDELQRSAAFFTQHSLSTASPLQGGNAGAALALNTSALLMLLTSLGAVLASKIVLGLLLGLGPLFIALLLFDATRGVFEGWLRASIGFALAPLLALLGLVVQLTLIGPDLARLAEARSQGLVDLAPANSIFLLTLISTGVSLALAIAVAVIATSLRLPKAFGRGAGAAAPTPLAAAVFTHQAHSAREVPSEPRALAVAAAATAMERREVRVDQADSGGPRRVVARAGRAETSAPALTLAPLGQTYRRTTAPRQAASNLRRDR